MVHEPINKLFSLGLLNLSFQLFLQFFSLPIFLLLLLALLVLKLLVEVLQFFVLLQSLRVQGFLLQLMPLLERNVVVMAGFLEQLLLLGVLLAKRCL